MNFLQKPYLQEKRSLTSHFSFNPHVIVLANSCIGPRHFRLREKDFEPLGTVSYPGRSAWLDFLDLPGGRKITNDIMKLLKRDPKYERDRRDHVYLAAIKSVNVKGFTIFWTPLRNNFLHVRIVHQGYISGKKEKGQPPNEKSYEKLAKAFQKHVSR